jgi:hypothetical protein
MFRQTARLVGRAAKRALRLRLLALLAVLGACAWLVVAAFAASGPPAPALSPSPNASLTNSSSETFGYSDSQAGATFSCTLDGVTKSCPGTTSGSVTFGSLAQGAHTFAISAVAGGRTSSATTYSWTVDTIPPTLSSIARTGSFPTNASAVSWTVTFSEAVTNVAAGDFTLAQSGLGGAPAITAVSGGGATWTVTASAGTGSGSLGLNYTAKGSIADLAGNPIATTPPVAGQVYTIDRTPPPPPNLTAGPANGSLSNQSSASFSFTDGEAGVTFLCKLDTGALTPCASPVSYSGLADGTHAFSVEAEDAAGNISTSNPSVSWTVDATPPPKPTIVGPNSKSDSTAATFTMSDGEANVSYRCQMDGSGFQPCPNPKTYTLLAPGTHEFDAEAVDQAGNVSPYNGWKWTINGLSGSGQSFQIHINGTLPSLYPGGASDPIDLTLYNPNSAPIYVNGLTITLASVTRAAGVTQPCSTSDFSLTGLGAGANLGTSPIMVPAGGMQTLTGAGLGAYLPTVRMKDSGVSQDGCQGATLNFTFGGTAQS